MNEVNREILEKLGLEIDLNTAATEEILEALEDKQLELEERLEQVEDAARKATLQEQKAQIEQQMKALSQESKAEEPKKNRVLPVAAPEEKKRNFLVEDTGEEKNNAIESRLQDKAEKKAQEKAEKEREKLAEKHEDELKKKAKEIRKKTAQEKQAEATTPKPAASNATQSTTTTKQSAKTAAVAPAPAVNTRNLQNSSVKNKDLAEAIREYAAGNFKQAKDKLSELANKPESYGLDETERGIAEHLFGKMYQRGEGVSKDETRALFWFERGAEHGNTDCCLEAGTYYAGLTPTSAKEADDNRKKTIRYYSKAAELGSLDAKKKYVSYCEKQKANISFSQRMMAVSYCDDAKEAEKDEFLKQKWDERAKALRMSEKKEQKQKQKVSVFLSSDKKWQEVLGFVGAILGIVSVLYLAQALLCDTVRGPLFSWLPNLYVSNWINIGQQKFMDSMGLVLLSEEACQLGYTATVLLVLSSFLLGFSSGPDRSRFLNYFCEARFVLGSFLCIYCIRYVVLLGLQTNRFDGEEYFLFMLAAVVVYAVARIPSWLVRMVFC